MAESSTKNDPLLPSGIGRELAIVFIVQMIAVTILVRLDEFVSLAGSLHALVGVVFILVPVLVLDRRGKPYDRYGMKFGRPAADMAWVLGAMVVTWVPIIIWIAFVMPQMWDVEGRAWSFAWPADYPQVALAHFIVVALPEEFFYRGYVMGRLDDIFEKRVNIMGTPVGWGLVFQALMFAIGHFLVDFHPARLAVFFPALAFGWLRLRRGSLLAPIVFHGACNVFMEMFRAGYGL